MLFVLSIRKSIGTGEKAIHHTVLYRAFHGASFEKIQGFILYQGQDICDIIKIETL
jgi:hypothetical protein